MIFLSKQTPLGTGRHRKCYTHPDNARRCIKVIYNRNHGGDKEIRRELNYYAHLSRYLTDWSAIPRYYGTVENRLRHRLCLRHDYRFQRRALYYPDRVRRAMSL